MLSCRSDIFINNKNILNWFANFFQIITIFPSSSDNENQKRYYEMKKNWVLELDIKSFYYITVSVLFLNLRGPTSQ